MASDKLLPPRGMSSVSNWLSASSKASWSVVSGAWRKARPAKAISPILSPGKAVTKSCAASLARVRRSGVRSVASIEREVSMATINDRPLPLTSRSVNPHCGRARAVIRKARAAASKKKIMAPRPRHPPRLSWGSSCGPASRWSLRRAVRSPTSLASARGASSSSSKKASGLAKVMGVRGTAVGEMKNDIRSGRGGGRAGSCGHLPEGSQAQSRPEQARGQRGRH